MNRHGNTQVRERSIQDGPATALSALASEGQISSC
jgi:hypothetical protein